MNHKHRREQGLIGTILLIVVALALLKYFLNWDIFDAANSEEGKSTILYIRDIFNLVWSYAAAPVIFVWDRIIWPLCSLAWNNLQHFIEWGQSAYKPIQ